MKKIFNTPKYLHLLLAVLVTIAVQSCKKDNTANYGTGAPTITRVRTLTKDTLVSIEHRLTLDSSLTYDEHRPVPFDSTTTSGKIYTPYMIVGTNLGSATHIYINGVEVYFNTALSTDKSIILTIPTDVPFSDASTPNKLKVVTQHGEVEFDFIIEQPFPSISSVNFTAGNAGDLITIKGTTFNGLSSVKFGTTAAEIVSSTATQATVKVPAGLTGPNEISLTTTASLGGGTTTGPLASNGYNPTNNVETFSTVPFGFTQLGFDDEFKNGWSDYGWSNSPDNNNTTNVLRGSKSIKVQYAGGYDGFVLQAPGDIPVVKSIKMSVYGGKGSDNKVIHVILDYNFSVAVSIVVKEGVWTSFNIPMSAFAPAGGSAPKNFTSIVFQEFSGNTTLWYLDDIGII
ncbi:IPT/TIG domain-containing protein [Mucilaginibacter pedocola]|uniref:IPT/TIG domain-containing protein n=1 Tax=Mucilaginibacter pedocola TaxID=1792845 RepID=A0A1S9PEP0_9SPHI|nr:IPT/TIG domain-containing protein [Mucilaginibacter pedocola]OOQ59411.1 hypothetical protein BC343_04305 [Mucilaginibacter pedocola]